MKKDQYPHDRPSKNGNSINKHKLDKINMESLLSGNLSIEDLQINAQTLLMQASISRDAGYSRLAENLTRASELIRVPNLKLLQLYESLRPGRSSYEELLSLASQLESDYNAPTCAKLFRETAEVYLSRGLLHK